MKARALFKPLPPSSADLAAANLGPCFTSDDLFDVGIGHAIASRILPGGQLSVSVFLVDVWCLGVKDAFTRVLRPSEFESLVSGVKGRPVPPSHVAGLLEQAVNYADSLGLRPHPQYQKASAVLAGVSSEGSPTYRFGDDGKPHFVPGPHMTSTETARILTLLRHRLGRDGFHYMMQDLQMVDI